jgi:hypothetical protein
LFSRGEFPNSSLEAQPVSRRPPPRRSRPPWRPCRRAAASPTLQSCRCVAETGCADATAAAQRQVVDLSPRARAPAVAVGRMLARALRGACPSRAATAVPPQAQHATAPSSPTYARWGLLHL